MKTTPGGGGALYGTWYIDASAITSDERMKRDIQPLDAYLRQAPISGQWRQRAKEGVWRLMENNRGIGHQGPAPTTRTLGTTAPPALSSSERELMMRLRPVS